MSEESVLFALGFKAFRKEVLETIPDVPPLLAKIGTAHGAFVRTASIGLGKTLVRDHQNTFRLADGQHDLSFIGYQEKDPKPDRR